MTPLAEILAFKFKDKKLQPRFESEASDAFSWLGFTRDVLEAELTNDLSIIKQRLCRYIECAGRLGTININMMAWQRLALNQRVEYHRMNRGDKMGLTEKEIHEMAVDDIRGIIELASLPEIYSRTIRENKAMMKTIMGQEMNGGYGG